MKTLEELAEEFCTNPPPGVSGTGFINVLVAFHKHALGEKIKEISKCFYGLNPSIEMLNDKQRYYDYGLGKAIEILKQEQ